MGSERGLSIWERLRVARFVRSGPLQDALAERTGLVFGNERASALEERAWELLDEGLSDERVVFELRKTAGRHRRDLAVAARIVKQGGYAFELSDANRAWRLLEAAATDSPVVKPTAEELARFEVLDELFGLPEAEGFARLATLSPELAEAEQRLRLQAQQNDTLPFERLDELIGPLVGPCAQSDDPIIRSQVAYRLTRQHLIRIPGLFEDD